MKLSEKQKQNIKNQIKNVLSKENEIQKIIIFGSFLTTDTPNDVDIAIFQNSRRQYLSLSMKYRKLMRDLMQTIPFDVIPIDVIPIKSNAKGSFLKDIESGEIIFER